MGQLSYQIGSWHIEYYDQLNHTNKKSDQYVNITWSIDDSD